MGMMSRRAGLRAEELVGSEVSVVLCDADVPVAFVEDFSGDFAFDDSDERSDFEERSGEFFGADLPVVVEVVLFDWATGSRVAWAAAPGARNAVAIIKHNEAAMIRFTGPHHPSMIIGRLSGGSPTFTVPLQVAEDALTLALRRCRGSTQSPLMGSPGSIGCDCPRSGRCWRGSWGGWSPTMGRTAGAAGSASGAGAPECAARVEWVVRAHRVDA